MLRADLDLATPEEVATCACSLGLLERVRPEHAAVLRRVDLDEEPIAEVARVLGVTTNNATVRLHRARVKPRELRYHLLWGHRYGFIQAAIRNQAPIIPLASIGADDLFDFVGNAYRRGERLLRRPGIPIPLPARILPIPHLVRLRYIFGDPIVPPIGPELANDMDVVRRLRHEVEGALHELIETELARRAGIDL